MSKAIQQPSLPSYFYFLVTGTLCISLPSEENPEEASMVIPTLNVVIKTDKPYFGSQALADANNGLQYRYRTESGDEKGVIANIVINSVFPMGLMTEEEYNWRKPAPEGE